MLGHMAATPPTSSEILARNIAAARVRRGLNQASLAARMQGLGYRWLRQTVSEVEADRRRVTLEEIVGLAYALSTSVRALARPTDDDKLVALPSGAVVAAASVQQLVDGTNDNAVAWDGNTPAVAPPVARIESPHGISYMLRGGGLLPADEIAELGQVRDLVTDERSAESHDHGV